MTLADVPLFAFEEQWRQHCARRANREWHTGREHRFVVLQSEWRKPLRPIVPVVGLTVEEAIDQLRLHLLANHDVDAVLVKRVRWS